MTVQLLQVESRQKHTTVPASIAIDSASFAALIETAKDGLDSTGADAIQFHDVTKPYALKGEAPDGTDIALLPGFACAVPRNRVNLLETPFSLQMNLNVTRAENGDFWSLVFVDRRDQEVLFTAKVPAVEAVDVAEAEIDPQDTPEGAAGLAQLDDLLTSMIQVDAAQSEVADADPLETLRHTLDDKDAPLRKRNPLETWRNTADNKDAPLRNQLTQLIGEEPALKVLVRMFPSGSAAAYLDNRALEISANTHEDDELSADGAQLVAKTVTAVVARELAEGYHEAQSALTTMVAGLRRSA